MKDVCPRNTTTAEKGCRKGKTQYAFKLHATTKFEAIQSYFNLVYECEPSLGSRSIECYVVRLHFTRRLNRLTSIYLANEH